MNIVVALIILNVWGILSSINIARQGVVRQGVVRQGGTRYYIYLNLLLLVGATVYAFYPENETFKLECCPPQSSALELTPPGETCHASRLPTGDYMACPCNKGFYGRKMTFDYTSDKDRLACAS